MPTFLKFFLLLTVFIGCAHPVEEPLRQAEGKPNPSQELSANEARELLPEAASLSLTEYSEILQSPPVSLGEIKNQSLTALLLAVDPAWAKEQNSKAEADFRYLTPKGYDPVPEMIHAAILGKADADFVSLIQPDSITNCTCDSMGDTAKGHVEYRAGNLYAGSADFTAKRQEDHWKIVAFHLPEFRLKTQRRPDGTWQLQSEEQLLGIAY